MASLLAPIRARLQLTLRRRAAALEDGAHPANVRGRSLEFEDLREYVPGDDVKDIDWKATARSAHPLVRRYAALRVRQVVLVVPTGRSMQAHAAGLDTKRDILREAIGALALVAVDQGDRVRLVHGDATAIEQLPPGSSQLHVERLLRVVDEALDGPREASAATLLLEQVTRRVRRRSLVVLVADDGGLDGDFERALRRLAMQHDLVWFGVRDLDPSDPRIAGRTVVDVDNGIELPPFLRADARIGDELAAARRERDRARSALLARLHVHELQLATMNEVLPGLVDLFERVRRARGRRTS